MENLETTLQQSYTNSDQDADSQLRQYQENICALLQVILAKVGSELSQEQINQILDSIIRLFKQANAVTEYGLIAL